jgi:hypothetical protein
VSFVDSYNSDPNLIDDGASANRVTDTSTVPLIRYDRLHRDAPSVLFMTNTTLTRATHIGTAKAK